MLHGILAGFLCLTALCGSEIRPIGLTGERTELAYQRLCSLPLSDLSFVLSDIHFEKTRRFTEYSGDISGRMVGALNATADVLGADPDQLPALLAELVKYQKPDGHFGVDQDLEKEVSQSRDMPILWGNGRMLLALAQQCAAHPDPELMKAALKLGDYIISTRKYYGIRENFEGVGGSAASGFTTCYPSLIDGLVALGEVSGEKRFLEEARFIANLSLLDQEFENHHSHGRLTAYRGMLDLDRVTGRHEFTAAVEDACAIIRESFLLPIGGVTEMFDVGYARDEGCSEADWIRVNYLLWQATGKTCYLDVAETALRNHLLALQCSNGGFGHAVFVPVKAADKQFPGRITGYSSEAYWCCSMHGAQVLADVARWGITKDGKDIVVTWLADVEAKFGPLTVSALQKDSTGWVLALESDKKSRTSLRLRVPAWSGDYVSVDGKKLRVKNGWANLKCSFTGRKEMTVQFDDKTRVVGAPGVSADVAARVYAGSDLYCLPDAWLNKSMHGVQDALQVVIGSEKPQNGLIPALVRLGDASYQKTALTPIVNRPAGGCRVIFNVKEVPAAEFDAVAAAAQPQPDFGAPMELRFASDGPCEVKLNGETVYSHNNWHESPLAVVYLEKDKGQVQVKLTAGKLRPAILGLIKSQGKMYATGPQGWTVRPEDGEQAAAAEIGPFGTPPWDYYPGHFAGTEAKWIGPAKPGDQKVWYFECELK